MAYTAQFPISSFLDVDGKPLENGYVYIGTAGLDPVANPITAYWDAAATQVAAQPIRTIGGYPSNAGVRSRLFVNAVDYSIKVTNVNGTDTVPVALYNAEDAYAADIIFLQAGAGAVARTVESKLRDTVSVKDFGAVGDGVTDDTTAIQNAINASSELYFPPGNYLVSAQINLKNDFSIVGEPGAKIILANGVTPHVLRGNPCNNFVMQNMTIEGNGLSGNSTVYISNSANVTIQNCKITKSGANAIWLSSCVFAKVENCILSSNYYYGLEFRDCDGCKAIANQCNDNGSTGVATSTGGRGIMLWRSRGCYIAGNRMVNNNEYGLRIYSEAADATTSNNNVITGNFFADNTDCDFLFYDEGVAFSFVSNNAVSDNVVYRTTNTVLGASFVLHGDFNTYTNNHVYKSGAFGTDVGFNFFNAEYCTITACSVHNMAQSFSTSSSENITIDNCFGDGVANALTVPTTGIIVKNCKFLHGGPGAADVAIINYNATGKNFYEGNIFDGFHTGIYIDDKPVAIFRNTTINSVFAGIRAGAATDISNVELGANSWDSAAPWELSALNKTISTYDKAVTYYISSPVSLAWDVGDRCYNSSPSVGQPKSWVCTVAGAPGTWTSEGNL